MDLTQGERVTLRDVLDIQIEAFEDAMHRDTLEPEVLRSWEALLTRAGSYGDIVNDLRSIRKKMTNDDD